MPFDMFSSTSTATDSRIGANDEALVVKGAGAGAKDYGQAASGKGKILHPNSVDLSGSKGYTAGSNFTLAKGASLTINDAAGVSPVAAASPEPRTIAISVPGGNNPSQTSPVDVAAPVNWQKWSVIIGAIGVLYFVFFRKS